MMRERVRESMCWIFNSNVNNAVNKSDTKRIISPSYFVCLFSSHDCFFFRRGLIRLMLTIIMEKNVFSYCLFCTISYWVFSSFFGFCSPLLSVVLLSFLFIVASSSLLIVQNCTREFAKSMNHIWIPLMDLK